MLRSKVKLNPPTTEITRYEEPTVGQDSLETGAISLPTLSLPKGAAHTRPAYYGEGTVTSYDEPSREQLRDFFEEHPEAAERFIACPNITQEMLSGFYDYTETPAPGYIYVAGIQPSVPGHESFNEATILENLGSNKVTTKSGITLSWLSDCDSFPYRMLLPNTPVTPLLNPAIFDYVQNELFGGGIDTELASNDPALLRLRGLAVQSAPEQ